MSRIRIVGGEWRSRLIDVSTVKGLRPTPDRVRETLFNWLGQDLRGKSCLDLFAGSGALGFEAASRGATMVLMNESDGALTTQLSAIAVKLKATNVRIQRGDGVAALRECAAGSMHLLLIDPPFDGEQFKPALSAASQAVAKDGFIYLEAPRAWTEDELAEMHLELYRHLKAGAVHAHLLRRK